MHKLFFLAMAGAAILLGQADQVNFAGVPAPAGVTGAVLLPGRIDGTMLPRPIPDHDALQQFLTLSPDQLQRLEAIVRTRQQAEQEIWTQISNKQVELHRLLESGSTDALTIGRLHIDIRDLQKQVPGKHEPYMQQALQVLNDAQKAKLADLSKALELQTAAHQALYLNLLPPRTPDVRILPMPVERSATLPLGL